MWLACIALAAEALLTANDVDQFPWWFNVVMLVVLFTFFRILSIIALARRAASFF